MTGALGFLKRRVAAPRVQLQDEFVDSAGSSALGATSKFRVNAAGTTQTKTGTAAYVNSINWLLTGTNADYEIQLAQLSITGGTLTGASASWLAMTADREVSFVTGTVGSNNTAVVRVKIRDKTTLVELATADITLDSEWV